MNLFEGIDPELVKWLIMPLMIFLARIIDVSIGTLRIILVGKGIRKIATIAGFFEVFVWIIAIGQIMQDLNNIMNYFAYASGFATGTYVGMYLENKISIGKVIVRIITRRDASELLAYLAEGDYHLTSMDARGRFGDVKIIFLVIKRKEISGLVKVINQYNPKAFYTIEDVRFVNNNLDLPENKPLFNGFSFVRKIFTIRK
jgi:uncharacterized protein YebE (UPF0316 family)